MPNLRLLESGGRVADVIAHSVDNAAAFDSLGLSAHESVDCIGYSGPVRLGGQVAP